MKSLGDYLQAERLARGLTLEEISADTRISLKMLRALEEGNTEELPAAVLVKGFLRAYAEKVKLDPEAVILKYQDLIEEDDARLEALEKFHRRIRPRPFRKKIFLPLVVFGLAVCLALSSWLFHQSRRRVPAANPSKVSETGVVPQAASPGAPGPGLPEKELSPPSTQLAPAAVKEVLPETSSPGAVEQASPAAPPLTQGVSAVPKTEPSPATATEKQVTAAFPSPATYVLRAEVLGTTWLQISIDEGRQLEYLLQPGEQLRWQGHSGFSLKIGNAAGLRLYLNGKPLKPIGQKGQVVQLHLPDPSLMVAADSPTANQ